MPGPFHVPPEKLCTAHKADGSPCKVARVAGEDRCCFHRDRSKGAVVPSITLDALTKLDLSLPEAIATFRTGLVQHLIGGTLEPHVAKVALDVAETIHKNARAKDSGSVVRDLVKDRLAKPPSPME